MNLLINLSKKLITANNCGCRSMKRTINCNVCAAHGIDTILYAVDNLSLTHDSVLPLSVTNALILIPLLIISSTTGLMC
jgi:hypothetical protein